MKHNKFFSLIILLFAAFIAGCNDRAAAEAKKPAETPTAVVVEKAAIETVEEHLRLVGDVMPWQIQPLSFKVGGKIARLFIEEGDLVKKNQLIAVLDTVDYRLVRDLADAQVEGLRPNLDRATQLLEQEAVSAAQLDELESRMKAAKIQRTQAATQLSYSWLRAPADGVVMKRMMSQGDLTDPAHPVAAIAELKRAKVILPVTQRDLPFFHEKDAVSLVEPGTGRKYEGSIFSIGFAADEKTRTFPVTIEVLNPDLSLRAGMVVEALVKIGEHRGIFVPLEAIHRDFEARPIVFVAQGNPQKSMERRIELGALIGERVLILKGIEPGDAVIVRGMVQNDELVKPAEEAASDDEAADAGAKL